MGFLKKIINFYDDIYYAFWSRNDTVYRQSEFNTARDAVMVDSTGLYADGKATYVYLMEGYSDSSVFKAFKTSIRGLLSEGMRANFLTELRPFYIDWQSPIIKSRLSILEGVAREEEEKGSTAYNLHSRLGTLRGQQHMEESLVYLSNASLVRKRRFMEMGITLMVSGGCGEEFDKSIEALERNMNNYGIRFVRVLYDVYEHLQRVSPFMLDMNSKLQYPTVNLTDEIYGSFITESQGLIGRDGLFCGIDIFSGFPVFMQPKQTAESASNIGIFAMTGWGKSQFMQCLLPQLLTMARGTIMDIEGFEYLPMAKALRDGGMNVSVINMAKGKGNYFDPVEIPKLIGREDVDSTLYDLSTSFTKSYLQAILAVYEKDHPDVGIIIDDTVSEMYLSMGVHSMDRSTWEKSKGGTLFDAYKAMCSLTSQAGDDKVSTAYRRDAEYQKALVKCIGRMATFFEEDGLNRAFFQKRIGIEDIINSDLLVCSFGLAGKTENMIDKFHVQLMQLSASLISFLRSLYSWLAGKFNFKIWEEFQRWGKFPHSDKTIGTALTGGRKLGDINIITTNQLRELLDDDRFSIIESLTSYFVGQIASDTARDRFCKEKGIETMKPVLDVMSDINVKSEAGKSSPYAYSFLANIQGVGVSVVRMPIPNGLLKSDIFQRGTSEDVTLFE